MLRRPGHAFCVLRPALTLSRRPCRYGHYLSRCARMHGLSDPRRTAPHALPAPHLLRSLRKPRDSPCAILSLTRVDRFVSTARRAKRDFAPFLCESPLSRRPHRVVIVRHCAHSASLRSTLLCVAGPLVRQPHARTCTDALTFIFVRQRWPSSRPPYTLVAVLRRHPLAATPPVVRPGVTIAGRHLRLHPPSRSMLSTSQPAPLDYSRKRGGRRRRSVRTVSRKQK